jgi:hypothetical protein
MVSMYRKMSLANVYSDGDEGFEMKATLPDGEVVALVLDAPQALRLAEELLAAGRRLLDEPKPKPKS